MPKVNHEILKWARETAGLSESDAVDKLGIKDARGIAASDRLQAIESGGVLPTRPLLLKMSQVYRRPLVTFYLRTQPSKGERGEDFRSLPDRQTGQEALVDALVRDVRMRQSVVRAVLVDEDEATARPFVGSMTVADGLEKVASSILQVTEIKIADFRGQKTPQEAFAYLRSKVESIGVFVLLIGNLGSHHTAIDVEAFRGFALSDPIAPFVIINDQDAHTAWSFTLLHELAHVWLGKTGVSGSYSDDAVERFCNDIAARILLPVAELESVALDRSTEVTAAARIVGDFARSRHLSSTMVAYNLWRKGRLSDDVWNSLRSFFRKQWQASRDASRKAQKDAEGPSYYIVRRHRLGGALLTFVSRSMGYGALSPTKAGRVLGVRPRSVAPLLGTTDPFGSGTRRSA
jgi:Zn-dependent peptidase ImmA (M78 family)/transcriptional regulator with XRE-family HTH domain